MVPLRPLMVRLGPHLNKMGQYSKFTKCPNGCKWSQNVHMLMSCSARTAYDRLSFIFCVLDIFWCLCILCGSNIAVLQPQYIISLLNLNTGMFFICTISSTLWRLWWCQKWKSRPRSTGWRWAQWHSPERLLLQPPCRPPTPPGCAATVLLSPTGEVPQLRSIINFRGRDGVMRGGGGNLRENYILWGPGVTPAVCLHFPPRAKCKLERHDKNCKSYFYWYQDFRSASWLRLRESFPWPPFFHSYCYL